MSHKLFAAKKFFQYYLPLTLTLFMTITVEREVSTDGGYDRLYGYPFAYISSSIGYTFHYEVYVLELILNLIFIFIIVVLGFFLLQKSRLQLKVYSILSLIGIAISVFWIALFYFNTIDSTFYLYNTTEYKTKGLSWILLL